MIAWLGERLGHWFIYMILTALVLFSLYVTVIKPHYHPSPTTQEQAQEINHNQPKVYFGCLNFAIPKK